MGCFTAATTNVHVKDLCEVKFNVNERLPYVCITELLAV